MMIKLFVLISAVRRFFLRTGDSSTSRDRQVFHGMGSDYNFYNYVFLALY